MSENKRLGILAGKGELPWISARRALEKGEDVKVFHYGNETPPEDLASIAIPVIITRMFKSVIASMKKENVGRMITLGKATRDILYNNPKFDLKTVYILARMRNTSDYTIFEYFSKEFEKNGITILPQTTYLDDMFLPEGRYGKKLSKDEIEDVSFGIFHAREMNRLDIGQTVVVGNRSVLAVEGAEGTDQCIRRGGSLFRKKGASVCKVAKETHDDRFDLPTTGFSTLESMKESGCRILAMEASRTFVIHPRRFIDRAKEYGISILSVDLADYGVERLTELNKREKKVEIGRA